MLLSITTTHAPARDLGYLVGKHPDRAQTFALSFGQAHVFFPEATDARCTAALLLDVDPVGLVRGHGASLFQYVNDRPYAATSFLSVAVGQVYRSAMNGTCKDRPDLAETPLPLEAVLTSVPCRGGDDAVRSLFEPLGYEAEIERGLLDDAHPSWGESPYVTLRLAGTQRLQDLLAHLYVLVPVLDGAKHYWIGDDEVDKLLARGAGWLETHPARAYITRRYLKRRGHLVTAALERLAALAPDEPEVVAEAAAPDGASETAGGADTPESAEQAGAARRVSLHEQRLDAALAILKASGAQRVLDLGCGEGRLLQRLVATSQFTEIVGMDVSAVALARAREKLRLDTMPPARRERIRLVHGSLLYRDARLEGFDAAAVVEVVEHLDAARLSAFERTVFAEARPALVVLTTPNREYNAVYGLEEGAMRHGDHRFEWTRAEFRSWAEGVAARTGYEAGIQGVGEAHPDYGAPSQLAVFTRMG